jgi:hypothetical protein
VEKIITMELSTFILIILGIYACYYLILIILDRFATSDRSNNLPKQTVYAFSNPVPSMPGLNPSEQAKDLLHPVLYLSSSQPVDDEDDIEGMDSDLQLIYLPDDEMEPGVPSEDDPKHSSSTTTSVQ